MIESVKRGDIVLVDFGSSSGSVQGGVRPAVVVQNDVGNAYSPTAIVCPMTSKRKKNIPTHVSLSEHDGSNKASLLLCEQITTIDKTKFLKKLGKVGNNKIDEVNKAVRISLGLE